MDQIGVHSTESSRFFSNDGETYEKMTQAINSGVELVNDTHYENGGALSKFTAILPILVVPKGCLWNIAYDDDGKIEGSPEQVSHVQYYWDSPFSAGQSIAGFSDYLWFSFSHIDIVTLDQLPTFIKSYFNSDGDLPSIFGGDSLLQDTEKQIDTEENI
jgi:hypothetical protein